MASSGGVFVTIAIAIAAWAAAECLRVARRPALARVAWTAGAAAMIVHSLAAFAVFYGWDHETAVALTARQTAALTGIAWGGGLYVNYALLAIWSADAIWAWVSPVSYAQRPAALDIAVRGFLYFMFVNGAIVFADGWMRALGMLAVGLVTAAWLIKRYKPAAF
jgi:hypothetical protein